MYNNTIGFVCFVIHVCLISFIKIELWNWIVLIFASEMNFLFEEKTWHWYAAQHSKQ